MKLDALAQRETPRRRIDLLPAGREPGYELQRVVAHHQRVVYRLREHVGKPLVLGKRVRGLRIALRGPAQCLGVSRGDAQRSGCNEHREKMFDHDGHPPIQLNARRDFSLGPSPGRAANRRACRLLAEAPNSTAAPRCQCRAPKRAVARAFPALQSQVAVAEESALKTRRGMRTARRGARRAARPAEPLASARNHRAPTESVRAKTSRPVLGRQRRLLRRRD